MTATGTGTGAATGAGRLLPGRVLPSGTLPLVSVVLAGALLAAGCTAGAGERAPRAAAFHDPAVPGGQPQLASFESCDEADQQLRAAVAAHVEQDAVPGTPGTAPPGAADAEAAPAPDVARGAAPSFDGAPPAASGHGPRPFGDAGEPDPAYSGTNVHEEGVEEPDLVKTDGHRIVTVTRGVLRVVDAASRTETGRLALFPDLAAGGTAGGEPGLTAPVVADLLLSGDRALVLASSSQLRQEDVAAVPEVAGPRLLLVDLAGDPRVVEEYTVDGSLVDARAVGSVARVVVRSASGPAFRTPDPDVDGTDADGTGVDGTDLAAWLPRYEVTRYRRTGVDTSSGRVDCTSVSRPASYTGTSMLTVLTFDLAAGSLGDGDPVTVVADGQTVYSNGLSLYVAHDVRAGQEQRTELFRFDTTTSGPPRYAAAGSVDGWLVDQYAMSEWDGHLRVATTSGDLGWGTTTGEPATESTMYVLAERGETLVVAGSVGGLGKGERIYSVRFTGQVGYVVTFHETDPLYTVDLRNPAAPVVLGELKITGYSSYLHPVGAGRLVGVGQEADLQGVIQGTQVSLFDVSDLTDPRLRDQHHLPGGRSEAEADPHAFLWWPPEELLVVPVTGVGALLLRVDGTGLTELDQISHPDPVSHPDQVSPDGGLLDREIRRSLVIEDTLWTVSEAGLAAHDLATADRVAWLPH